MTNSVDPDQLASSEANWSGSTLFAYVGHIWVQQDQGKYFLSDSIPRGSAFGLGHCEFGIQSGHT